MSSWSREAVIYEIYVRSFADSDGDGVGDLAGIVSRLDYLAELGVDAVWITPFYPSPMADGGYDVADYRDVDPRFGSLGDFDKLLNEAHDRGIRVMIDLVPNHCSSAHPWFQAALAAGPGSPERELFHFRSQPSRTGGEAPPNNWQSVFHGPAWTRLPDGDWYLHLFAPEQPDLNWDHPTVRAEFLDVLRFWLERGVDGIRIDVAHGLAKSSGLPDSVSAATASSDSSGDVLPGGSDIVAGDATPYYDQEAVHEIYRAWRSILDSYAPERIAVAEAWLPTPDRTARYVRPDELHQAFNFEFLTAPWSASAYRAVIDASLAAMSAVGAPATWVMSNHDVVRPASRLAAGVGGAAGGAGVAGGAAAHATPEVGRRRARAAALFMLALPGSAYLYQGEELGLPEVFDLPPESRQDPIFTRSGGVDLGRDGCRVPLPWSRSGPSYGFGPHGAWLPQPPSWAELSVAAQREDPDSTLSLYLRALRLRRDLDALGDGPLEWREAPDGVLHFARPGSPTVVCVVNLGTEPAAAPVAGAPVVISEPLTEDGQLRPDSAAWWLEP